MYIWEWFIQEEDVWEKEPLSKSDFIDYPAVKSIDELETSSQFNHSEGLNGGI